MKFEKCKAVLLKETELVQKTAALQDKVRNAVINREWTDFEDHIGELNAAGAQFAALEAEREGLFPQLRGGDGLPAGPGDEKSRFYAVVSGLPAEQRNELTGIYRNLKMEAIKVRLSNEAFLAYLAEVKTTMAGFLDLAFPDRSGRIYTRHGKTVSQDMRSVVLNRSF
ncbi:MAG: hypothetical protein LBS57_03480 [Treponema sp.]|jgi:hypothetical protein|nr:hypothetical protein [Treponema sp.]